MRDCCRHRTGVRKAISARQRKAKFLAEREQTRTELDNQVMRLDAFMSLAMFQMENIRVKYRPVGFVCPYSVRHPPSSACSAIIALRSEPRRSITADRVSAAAPEEIITRAAGDHGDVEDRGVNMQRHTLDEGSREKTPRAALWRRSEGRRQAPAR